LNVVIATTSTEMKNIASPYNRADIIQGCGIAAD
jgi:hypothetical protein